jgi:hypothetical protein
MKCLKHAKEMKEGYDDELTEAKKLKRFEVFCSKPGTIITRYLDKDMWEEYKDMKCEMGVPFKDIIYPGVKLYDKKGPCFIASSLSCYKLYHKMFEKYLHSEFMFFRSDANHPELISSSFENSKFKESDNELV